MNFINIYEYSDYDKEAFADIIERVKSFNFISPKYVVSDDSISVACDVVSLFKTNFFIFKDYIEFHGFYKEKIEINKIYNRTNKSAIEYYSNALRSLDMAVASSNIPLAMRIMRSLYESLVISIALNYRLANQKLSILNKSAIERAESISKGVDIKDNDDDYYINKIAEKLKNNDINSIPSLLASFESSLNWTVPLFKTFDESKIKKIFNKSFEQLSENIKIEDITKVLGIFEFDSMHQMTSPFYYYSIVDIYLNSKNPTITPLYFDNANELGISYYSNYEKAFFLDELKQLTSLFSIYFRSTSFNDNKLLDRFEKVNEDIVLSPFLNIPDNYYPKSRAKTGVRRISFDIGNESSYVNIVKKFRQQAKNGDNYSIKKDDYYKNLEFCNIDSMFIKIIKNIIKSESIEEKESINNYFATYKDNYIVCDDAFSIDSNNPRWFDNERYLLYGYYNGLVNENHSSNLAYKWQNVFKSLLNGLRFYDIKKLPIEAKCKLFENAESKKVFINYNSENIYKKEELATAQFLISSIQSFTNICNLILINDASTALNEAKKLYESIILKTYIGIKNKKDFRGVILDQEKLTVFKFLSESMNYTTINIQLTNDKKELIERKVFPTKEYESERAEYFYKMKQPKLIKDIMNNNKPFSFTAEDELHSINDIAKYLSNKIGLDVSVSIFNRMYLLNQSINSPFFSDDDVSDNTLSLMILDFASLLNRTLPYDIIADLIDDKRLKNVMDIINFMIKKDLGEINV